MEEVLAQALSLVERIHQPSKERLLFLYSYALFISYFKKFTNKFVIKKRPLRKNKKIF